MISKTIIVLSSLGVASRDRVKSDKNAISALIRRGLVRKVWKRGRVFFELTEVALPALDVVRCLLREEAKLRAIVAHPRRRAWYQALLEDPRFLDVHHVEAAEFRFLGDWRLQRVPTKSQLQLAQFRFYQQQGLA